MSDGGTFLSVEQKAALERVAEAFGWDRMSLDQVRLLAWSAFHYYVRRMHSQRKSEDEAMKDTYVSIAQWGNCKVCGEHKDLRYGSCFKCSDFVLSTKISPVTYRLWDSRNPTNEWFASETHN